MITMFCMKALNKPWNSLYIQNGGLMLAILNSLNAHNLPFFTTDFDDTCIKIHGS